MPSHVAPSLARVIGLAPMVAVALAIQIDGGLQTELGATRRSGSERSASEWAIAPWVAAGLASPGTTAEFRYSPRVILRYRRSDPSPQAATELLHALSGEVRHRSSRTLEVSAKAAFERGRVELDPLRVTQLLSGVDALAVPSVREVDYVHATTSLGLSARVDRRTSWSSTVGYRLIGDLRNPSEPTSSAALPWQRGPEWTTSLEHALTRRDALLARAAASGVYVREGWILQAHAMGGWSRALSRNLSLAAALGVGAQTREGPQRVAAMPVGNVALAYVAATRAPVRAQLAIGALPFVDPFTGAAYRRTDASLATSCSLTPAFDLHALVAIGGPWGRDALRSDASGYASGGATLLLRRGASLSAGVRASLQRRIFGMDRPEADWGAFLGFSYDVRTDT